MEQLPENFLSSFDIKKHFIEEKNWDKMAKCIHRIFLDLYEGGVLSVNPLKVTAGYRPAENNAERFEVTIYFGDEEYWSEYLPIT